MNINFDEWYEKLLIESEIIDPNYTIKNMPILRPFGISIYNTIIKYIENEWYKQGIEKIHFPLMMPKSFVKKRNEINNEISNEMFNLFTIWIKSYKDLPYRVQQRCMVNSDNPQKIIPFIRELEEYVNEIYTCHDNIVESQEDIEQALTTYESILSFFGIYGIRVRKPKMDTIDIAETSDIIITTLPSGKVLEIIRVHNLGEKLSRKFDIKFTNRYNHLEFAKMTSHNTSTRLLAACISAHCDSIGLVLPSLLCKYHVVIIPLISESVNYCERLYDKLKIDYKVHLDIRSIILDEKRKYYDKLGVAIRLEIDDKQIYIKIRNKKEYNIVSLTMDNIMEQIEIYLKKLNDELKDNAKLYQESMIHKCNNLNEIKITLEQKGGIIKIPYYSGDIVEESNKILNVLCNGKIIGFLINEHVNMNELCAITWKPAVIYAIIGIMY
jgi:prolyl-tRNA synthetase